MLARADEVVEKAIAFPVMRRFLALTDDYAMSALTVAIWGKPDQICSMRDFLRMTLNRQKREDFAAMHRRAYGPMMC